MDNRGCGLIRTLFVFALAVAPGVADEQTYRVRGVGGLPDATRIAMARTAEPSWHTVSVGGSGLRELLQGKCGRQGAQVDALLEQLTLKLNGGATIDRRVEPGVAVALPFCLKLEQRVPVTVDVGDTLESLLIENYGLAGRRTMRETLELNNSDGRWRNAEHFSRSLLPGQTVVLPYRAIPQLFRPADRGSDARLESSSVGLVATQGLVALAHETARPPAAEALLANAAPALHVLPSPRAPHEYDYVSFVAAADAAGADGCSPDSAGKPPFLADLLRRRLDIEAAAAERFTGPRRPELVGIIDSGISGPDTGVFRSNLLHPNPWELRGIEAKDDDRPANGFIDDVFGINFNEAPQSGSIFFYPHDPDFAHGTLVGSLVLGGKEWVDGQSPAALPWVRLKVVNFSHSTAKHPVDARALAQAISYLVAHDARVVNMSLSNRQRIEAVDRAMEATNRTLFVVAAGNHSPQGFDLAVEEVYPAKRGGRHSSIILTVGAHNDTDARGWANFSNHSPEYVDLLAPGCSVPTLNVSGNPVRESGTSIATAVVSFAAGLIGALGESDARNLKNRLLASVDVDAALATRAWSSGRLNVIKAVSLSHDVLERTDAAAPYDFVQLADRDELRKFCNDANTREKLGEMRKVRPNVTVGAETRIEYWVQTGERLEKLSCVQGSADQSIGTIVMDNQQLAGPALSELRDIVLADRPH